MLTNGSRVFQAQQLHQSTDIPDPHFTTVTLDARLRKLLEQPHAIDNLEFSLERQALSFG